MKTAHAIFGAVVAAFGVAAFVTIYEEFEAGTQIPPRPNTAAQKADPLTPANSIARLCCAFRAGGYDRARAWRRAEVRSDGPHRARIDATTRAAGADASRRAHAGAGRGSCRRSSGRSRNVALSR